MLGKISLFLIIMLMSFADRMMAQDLFLLDNGILKANKSAYRQNSPEVVTGVAEILKIAIQYLDSEPLSVLEKSFTPSSNTKHDYMSMGPYWWPDTTKADGLPYIRKDGLRNPEINKITDREYLGKLETRCKYLALAYYFTNDERFIDKATELLTVWFINPSTKMNPNLNFAQAIPGLNEGRGIGIIESRLLAYLVDWITILSSNDTFRNSELPLLKSWYGDFLTWLLNSPNGKEESLTKNNHRTFYELQVASFADFSGSENQFKKSLAGLKHLVNEQFDHEGKQALELERTNAFTYSAMNLSGWFSLAQLAECKGLNLWKYQTSDGGSLRAGLDFMIPYVIHNKISSYEQISPFNKEDFYHLLRIGYYKYADVKYKELADNFPLTPQTALSDLLYKLPTKQ